MFVFLILANGKTEKESRKAICELQKGVKPEGIAQADFKCSIEGLKEQYSSLILSNSTEISDLPEEEYLLNPVLTDNAIKEGKLVNYSLTKNKKKYLVLLILILLMLHCVKKKELSK